MQHGFRAYKGSTTAMATAYETIANALEEKKITSLFGIKKCGKSF